MPGQFPLKPFSATRYNAALQSFHAPETGDYHAPTVEYLQALIDTFHAGTVPHNNAIDALALMRPDALQFATDGDFRNFYVTPEFTADVGQQVVALIGVTHWFG